jgi:hypothetical protein
VGSSPLRSIGGAKSRNTVRVGHKQVEPLGLANSTTVAYFRCLRSCELVVLTSTDIEQVSEGFLVRITRKKQPTKVLVF